MYRTPDLCRLHSLLENSDGFFFDRNTKDCTLFSGSPPDPIKAETNYGSIISTVETIEMGNNLFKFKIGVSYGQYMHGS